MLRSRPGHSRVVAFTGNRTSTGRGDPTSAVPRIGPLLKRDRPRSWGACVPLRLRSSRSEQPHAQREVGLVGSRFDAVLYEGATNDEREAPW